MTQGSDFGKNFCAQMEERGDDSTVIESHSVSEADDGVGGYNSNNVKKAKLHSVLAALLDDPILADVPKKPTLMDVDTLINLELGSAMRISVLKLDGSSFDVAVMNSATVKDLKLAIKKKVNEMEQSEMGHRQISWRHVWANHCLSYHNQKLLDDKFALQDYGIRNHSQEAFKFRSILQEVAELELTVTFARDKQMEMEGEHGISVRLPKFSWQETSLRINGCWFLFSLPRQLMHSLP